VSIYQTILERRSIRRFKQAIVDFDALDRCVNAARLAPTANNRQRLQYIIVTKEPGLSSVFSSLSWAGYLEPRWEPGPGERPTAYIVILADGPLKALGCDAGAAAENIVLTALDAGVGACILGSVEPEKVKKALSIPDTLRPILIVALGYPDERPVTVDFKGSVRYWRDENGVHRVPKRSLEAIRHIETYKT